MKKLALIPIIVMIAVGVYAYYSHGQSTDVSNITNYPSKGKNIIAFGDSLIAGVGASEGHDLVSVLSKKLNVKILNKGVSGNTTGDALDRMYDVTDNDPKVVIVLLGGNDAIKNIPIETTFANLSQIITKIQNTGAVVVLLGIQGGVTTDPYAQRFEEIAAKYHTLYVPNVLNGLFAHSEYMSDQVHPNDQGYEIIAEQLAPIIKPVLH